MPYRLDLYPSRDSRVVELSQETVRPSSLVVPQMFACIAFRSMDVHYPGGMTPSGLIIAPALPRLNDDPLAVFGQERDRLLRSYQCDDLEDLVEHTTSTGLELVRDGYVDVSGRTMGNTTADQESAIMQIRQQIERQAAQKAASTALAPSEPEPHYGMYL